MNGYFRRVIMVLLVFMLVMSGILPEIGTKSLGIQSAFADETDIHKEYNNALIQPEVTNSKNHLNNEEALQKSTIYQLEISSSEIQLKKDETTSVKVSALYTDNSKRDVTKLVKWEVTDPAIVKVNKGKITAIAEGKTTIKALYKEKEVEIPVTIESKVEAPTLTLSEMDGNLKLKWNEVKEAQSYTIKRGICSGLYEEIASNITDLSYIDSQIENGKNYYYVVQALYGDGTTMISNEVTNENDPSSSLKLESSEKEVFLTVGEDKTINIFEGNTKDKTKKNVTKKVNWKVNDQEILTMEKGKITAKAAGKTTIQAVYKGQKVTIPVNVTIAETTTRNLILLSNDVKRENGKITVTGVIENRGILDRRTSLVVTGYGSNNEPIEVKSSNSKTLYKNAKGTFTLVLDTEELKIQNVKVEASGNNTAEMNVLLTSGVKRENGKLTVTGVIENSRTLDCRTSLVVTGYGSNNEPIEVKSSDFKTIFSTAAGTFTVVLDTEEAKIQNVKIEASGNNTAEMNVLLTSGVKRENGKLTVTGVIENSRTSDRRATLVVTGYGSNYEPIEVKSSDFKTIFSTATGTFTVVLDTEESKIQNVKVEASGNNTAEMNVLLTSGVKKENGKLTVTGVIENSRTSDRRASLVVTGYGSNNEPIEVKSSDFKTIFSTAAGTFKVVFDTEEAKIQNVKVEVSGNNTAEMNVLLASGVKRENGKLTVTGVIENSRTSDRSSSLVVTGYGSNNEPIEVKSSNNKYIFSNATGTFTVALDTEETKIQNVKVEVGGNSTEEKMILLAKGMKRENGVVTVTGVIENGNSSIANISLISEAYGLNNQRVETKTTTRDYISSKDTRTYKIIFDSPETIISRVVTYVEGQQPDIGPQFEELLVNTPKDINLVDGTNGTDKNKYFQFTPSVTGNYRFFTSPYQGTGPANDTILSLYSDQELKNEIAQNDNIDPEDGNLFSEIEYNLTAGFTYYIKLNTVDSNDLLYSRLTVEEDFDSTHETAIPATWEEIYTNRLSSPYDIDYFKVTVTEVSDIHLMVSENKVILEDEAGNELSVFYPDENTVYEDAEIGTYYAKVVYSPSSLVTSNSKASKNGISIKSNENVGGKFSARYMTRIPSVAPIVTTPGKRRGVTFKWNYSNYHNNVVISVIDSTGSVKYRETRNVEAGVQQFAWNGQINANFDQEIDGTIDGVNTVWDGTYVVVAEIKDPQDKYYGTKFSGRATVEGTDEYYLNEYLESLSNSISQESIKRMQENLTKIKVYDGPITGKYNKQFYIAVITYQSVIQADTRRASLGLQFDQDGVVTTELVNFSNGDVQLGRDYSGTIQQVFLLGDVLIVSVAFPVGDPALAGLDISLATSIRYASVAGRALMTSAVTKTGKIVRGVNFKWAKPEWSGVGAQLLSRSKDIRNMLPSDLKRQGNVGVAKIEVEGIEKEIYAHSGINRVSDKGANKGNFVLELNTKHFPSSVVKTKGGVMLDRSRDSEYKILNHIADKLKDNTNISGRIDLYTDRPPCDSCTSVIQLFQKKYPNIDIHIYADLDKFLKDEYKN